MIELIRSPVSGSEKSIRSPVSAILLITLEENFAAATVVFY